MRMIDADALKASIPETETDIFENCQRCTTLMDYEVKDLINKQPTVPAPRWNRVEDELPNDGDWAIFTNGKVVSVERFKEDAYNHFFPASEWFDFEDAIAWMPLPEPPKGDA